MEPPKVQIKIDIKNMMSILDLSVKISTNGYAQTMILSFNLIIMILQLREVIKEPNQ